MLANHDMTELNIPPKFGEKMTHKLVRKAVETYSTEGAVGSSDRNRMCSV